MKSNSQERELAKKREEEEFIKTKMDPACPGCHQRVVSQGCTCIVPKSPPKLAPKPKTPRALTEKTPEEEKEVESRKGIWTQQKDGSFTYIQPRSFSIHVENKSCTLFFSKKSPDFNLIPPAFNQFEMDHNLIRDRDFKMIKSGDRLIIQFFNREHYEKFIDHLLNKTPGLSEELRSALKALPRPAPKGPKTGDEEGEEKSERKTTSRSPFRIPDLTKGPHPYDK